jgi:hypothetical protein
MHRSQALLPFSNASCSVTVFNTACDPYSIITVVPERRETEIWRGTQTGDKGHVVFGKKKIPTEKGHVRWCVVVMQQPVLLSPKFGAKSSHIFTRSP